MKTETINHILGEWTVQIRQTNTGQYQILAWNRIKETETVKIFTDKEEREITEGFLKAQEETLRWLKEGTWKERETT